MTDPPDRTHLQRFLSDLRNDAGPAIVRAGKLPRTPFERWAYRVTVEVVITRNRRLHYLERHPDVFDDEPLLLDALRDPDEVHRNAIDAAIAIVYRRIDEDYCLRVPIWMSNRSDRQNSVLSLRRARQREVADGARKGRQVWRR